MYINDIQQVELPNKVLNMRIDRAVKGNNAICLTVGLAIGLFTGLMLGPIVGQLIWG